MILIPPSVRVFADSSDVSECSESFSGTISEPFNADPIITINSVTDDYDVEFDYVFAIGDEGTISFLKSSALEPSIMTFVEGETISTILTSGEAISDGVMKFYDQDISDCDILFNSSSIPESKRMALSIVSITEVEPSKFLVKAAIPDADSAKNFTKLAIAYVTNLEASVSYNIRNVAIVSPDTPPTIQTLIDDIDAMNLPHGVQTSLTAPLKNAQEILDDDNTSNDNGACGKLSAFVQKVNSANKAHSLTADQAASLLELAEAISSNLGC
jgi:hypothetical protein